MGSFVRALQVVPLGLCVAMAACSSSHTDSPTQAPDPTPQTVVSPWSLAPFTAPVRTGCAPGELTLATGACVPAGIEACAPGFASDGARGCNAVLPDAPCPSGTMAVPGDRACREIMPCGVGAWGDLVRPAGTQHVDPTYTVGDSDGSVDKPWTTIGAAVAAAADGATVAVAAGTYTEVVVVMKRVTISGRCPSMVEVQSPSLGLPSFIIREGGDGATVRGVSTTAALAGFMISGAKGILVDRVRVHGLRGGAAGLIMANNWGPATATIRDSLVEDNAVLAGLSVLSATLVVERTVVRDTTLVNADNPGRGINVESQGPVGSAPGRVEIHGSLVERSTDLGVAATSADVVIDASVVRGTLLAPDAPRGFGVLTQGSTSGGTASATIKRSVIEHNYGIGVLASAAKLDMVDTVVRDTLEGAAPAAGRGLEIQWPKDGDYGTDATVRSSVFERNHEASVIVTASRATMEGVIIRDTLPRSDHQGGMGIVANYDINLKARPSTLTMRGSRIERSMTHGAVFWGADVTLESVLVSDVRALRTNGPLGDGIVVGTGAGGITTLVLRRSRIERAERAGLANLSSVVTLIDSDIGCNAIDIDAEHMDNERPYQFDDKGGNACGCTAKVACGAKSANIAPPSLAP